MRPSGAIAIAVADASDVVSEVSVKPLGRFAAGAAATNDGRNQDGKTVVHSTTPYMYTPNSAIWPDNDQIDLVDVPGKAIRVPKLTLVGFYLMKNGKVPTARFAVNRRQWNPRPRRGRQNPLAAPVGPLGSCGRGLGPVTNLCGAVVPPAELLADSFLQLSLPVEHHRKRRRRSAAGERTHQKALAILAHFVAAPNNESIQHRHWKQALRLAHLKRFRNRTASFTGTAISVRSSEI